MSASTTRSSAPSSPDAASRTGIPAREILAQCDVTPEQVTDIFITHAHFDHIGGTDEFPNATFYIQERELSKWIWAMSLGRKFSWLTGAHRSRRHHADGVRGARRSGWSSSMATAQNVLPGIDIHAALDSHTWGCMFVRVRNDGQAESRRQLGLRRRSRLLHGESRGAARRVTAITSRSASRSAASSIC